MSPEAKLYLDRMDLEKYCGDEACELCKVEAFEQYIANLKEGKPPAGPCAHWTPAKIEAFKLAATAGTFLPEVPMLDVPRIAEPGLFDFNEPGPEAPLLITGNSEFTQAVMFAICSMTSSPVRLLSMDTKGHTVDMALVFKEFKAEVLADSIQSFGAQPVAGARVVLPGLAATMQAEIEERLGRPVEFGPVCAAELPLYMGEDWQPL